MAEGGATYTQDLFSCFDELVPCIFAWFCSPCSMGFIKGRIEGGSSASMDIPWTALGCFCGPCAAFMTRSKVNEKYGIEEGGVGKCFSACCCYPCAASQMVHEAKLKGDYPQEGL